MQIGWDMTAPRREMLMTNRVGIAIVALSGAALACSIFIGGPDYPDPRVQASPDALQTMESQVEAALAQSLADGTLRVSFTQEQLTAFLEARLGAQPEPILTDPQVVLTQQEMIVYGRARSWILEANVSLAVTFAVDAQGSPQVTVRRADFGPLPMPQAVQAGIAAALDEALTGYVGPVALGFRLEAIEISDGVITLTGRIR